LSRSSRIVAGYPEPLRPETFWPETLWPKTAPPGCRPADWPAVCGSRADGCRPAGWRPVNGLPADGSQWRTGATRHMSW